MLLEEARRQAVRDDAEPTSEGANALPPETTTIARLIQEQPPEHLAAILGFLRGQREDLREQLELERLVKRPPRKGFELIHPEDDEPSSLARTVKLVEGLIQQLEMALGTE